MLTHVVVAGQRLRVNQELARADIVAFKAAALTTTPVDDAERVRMLKPLLQLLIHHRDFRRYWGLSILLRRSYREHKQLIQTILTGCGMDDLLDDDRAVS